MNVQAINIARIWRGADVRMNQDGLAGYVANTDTTEATAFYSPLKYG